jgi:hypothetical protein
MPVADVQNELPPARASGCRSVAMVISPVVPLPGRHCTAAYMREPHPGQVAG